MKVGHNHINMLDGFGELRQPLQTMKWVARLYAFVFAVVMVNLIIFPLGGAYDPSDFFHTVFKDLPLVSIYAFFGIISLFMFVYWMLCSSSEPFVWPTLRRTYARPPRQSVLRQALYSTVLACRAPPVSA